MGTQEVHGPKQMKVSIGPIQSRGGVKVLQLRLGQSANKRDKRRRGESSARANPAGGGGGVEGRLRPSKEMLSNRLDNASLIKVGVGDGERITRDWSITPGYHSRVAQTYHCSY